jgi:hypothetical protein
MKFYFFKLQHYFFSIFIYLSYISILISILGLSDKGTIYMNIIEYYMKMYISIFLIIRFNPFTKIEFNELDRKVVFTSGMFLFTTTTIAQLGQQYIKRIFM